MTGPLPFDPEWAWSPYEPSRESPWDVSRAAHLYRRAGWGATYAELQTAVDRHPLEVVEEICSPPATPNDSAFEQESSDIARAMLATGNAENLAPWWLHRIRFSPSPLLEKMTLFWHGHFATSAAKVTDAALMHQQNELLRRHVLGDFAELAQGISHDPAMLVYLDSDRNRRAHPNENYARELMELFCLGEGHYSESDVQQLARCFTGSEVRRGRYYFNRFQHDRGEKQIFGKSGNWGSREGVQVVLEHPRVGWFLVEKLYRFFIREDQTPPPALLAPLVEEFRDGSLQIQPLLRRIFSSQLFFAGSTLGRKIRMPLELTLGWLRSLDGTANWTWLAPRLAELGQGLFYPPSVKGWDGGRAWINSATVVGRTNTMIELFQDNATRFAGGTLEQYLRRAGKSDPQERLDWLATQLLATPLSDSARARLVGQVESAVDDTGWRRLLSSLASLPEAQLQ